MAFSPVFNPNEFFFKKDTLQFLAENFTNVTRPKLKYAYDTELRARVEDYLKSSLGVSEVFLFGSASMRCEVPKSDLDYAVCAKELEGRVFDGAMRLYDFGYKDDFSTFKIELEFEGRVIEVSVKKDFEIFKTLWSNIPRPFYEDYLNKRSSKFIGKRGVCDYINLLKKTYELGFDKGCGEQFI